MLNIGYATPVLIVRHSITDVCHVQWFHVHRVLGSVAWVAGIVGVSFGQYLLAANPVCPENLQDVNCEEMLSTVINQ